MFLKYLRTASSEHLSDAAILIFRRYFGSSSLSVFYKVSVLKNICEILRKAHMLETLFNNFVDLKSKILLNERLHHEYFSMKKFYLKNTFLTGRLRTTASDT